MKKALKFVLILTLLLAAAEGLLRLGLQAPAGFFDFLLPAEEGLYPPNDTILNYWGLIPFEVQTNSLGLRMPEASGEKSPGKKRVVLIGDSMTDGFFVDNTDTYPTYLRQLLEKDHPGEWEVFPLARGGASIDKELAILKEIAIPLAPERVVLMFYTNDIYELSGKKEADILNSRMDFHPQAMSWKRRWFTRIVTRTALGETLVKAYWKRMILKNRTQVFGEDRYAIEGGEDFDVNVEEFNRRFGECCDGIILKDTVSAETEQLVQLYFSGLTAFRNVCLEAGIEMMLVYCPAYPQIYDPDASSYIQERLHTYCAQEGIRFADLSAGFSQKGKSEVLHLAPIDFHLNPDGNRLLAELIRDSLFYY